MSLVLSDLLSHKVRQAQMLSIPKWKCILSYRQKQYHKAQVSYIKLWHFYHTFSYCTTASLLAYTFVMKGSSL